MKNINKMNKPNIYYENPKFTINYLIKILVNFAIIVQENSYFW